MFGRRKAGGQPRRPRFALDEARLVKMRPTFDRRIASGKAKGKELAGLHALRALAHRVTGDHEASLADADAALAMDARSPEAHHQAVWALAEAVIALERVDRYVETVGRLEAMPTDGLDPRTGPPPRSWHART